MGPKFKLCLLAGFKLWFEFRWSFSFVIPRQNLLQADFDVTKNIDEDIVENPHESSQENSVFYGRRYSSGIPTNNFFLFVGNLSRRIKIILFLGNRPDE